MTTACDGSREAPPTGERSRPAPTPFVTFTDVTAAAGIRFRHVSGTSPASDKHIMETFGGGACWLDADGDTLLDLFLVQSGARPGYEGPAPQPSRLYRNEGHGAFSDVSEASGIRVAGYGTGCASADYDNDGRADLLVTQHGPDQLFHGEGGGGFRDVSAEAGIGDPGLSSSAAFADFDGDGYLDLYVANYVPVDPARDPACGDGPGRRTYCHPRAYEGVRDVVFRNRGDGTFDDVSDRAIPATEADPHFVDKGLGVAISDYDQDGDVDVFVANDACPNFLWRNRGDGTFEDVSLSAGVAFDLNGVALASMGCDWGDFDGDGHEDVFTTHFELETNTLYRNQGDATFRDVTYETGMGAPSLPLLAFGARFTDVDLDGDLDVLVANGHIFPDIALRVPGRSYPQPMQLFRNLGGSRGFEDATSSAGTALSVRRVGRALAIADHDEDGDEDVLVTAVDDDAALLRNDAGHARSWIGFALQGTVSNRDGIGARIEITAKGRRQVATVTSAGSYLSAHDLRRRFGLGDATTVEAARIRWPSGVVQELTDLRAGTVHRVVEPRDHGARDGERRP